MPWEPQPPEPPPATPPEPTSTSPDAPAPPPSETPLPEPLVPPADDAPTTATAGLISAAPVGWAPEPPPAAGSSPIVGWVPPTPAVAAAASGDLVISPVLPRVVAYIFDALILGLVNVAIQVALGVYGTDGVIRLATTPEAIAASLIGALIDVLYFVGLWRSSGRATVGMRIMHLRVVDIATGATMSVGAAARRWLLLQGVLTLGLLAINVATPGDPSLGFVAAVVWILVLLVSTATSPQKQGVHDRWASSVVLRPAGAGSGAAVVTCLVIIFAIGILPIIALILLGSQLSTILSEIGQSI
jgi:uncharacterized RDD family membrane protein YckC